MATEAAPSTEKAIMTHATVTSRGPQYNLQSETGVIETVNLWGNRERKGVIIEMLQVDRNRCREDGYSMLPELINGLLPRAYRIQEDYIL